MVTSICEFCAEVPTPPWIYCQKDTCRTASISRLVQETRAIRANKALAAEKQDASAIVFKTQNQTKCPLCKGQINAGPRSPCNNCKTIYHNDCLLELTGSRCATLGCGKYVAIIGEH